MRMRKPNLIPTADLVTNTTITAQVFRGIRIAVWFGRDSGEHFAGPTFIMLIDLYRQAYIHTVSVCACVPGVYSVQAQSHVAARQVKHTSWRAITRAPD